MSHSIFLAGPNSKTQIIWKEAEYFSLQGDFLEALAWYRFSQHVLFHRASEVNKMKILRLESWKNFKHCANICSKEIGLLRISTR